MRTAFKNKRISKDKPKTNPAGHKGNRRLVVILTFLCSLTFVSIFILNSKVQYNITFILQKSTWINIFTLKQDSETEFRKQWLRMLKSRVDWEGILAPCIGHMQLNNTMPGWGKVNETSGEESFIKFMDIRPAGQFSRIFIQTRTKDGRNKTIGGDYWRVMLSGPASISATVFDHRNGTYEALVLLMEPGNYSIIAVVERSLCEGLKELPEGFFNLLVKHGFVIPPSKYDGSIPGLGHDNVIFERLQRKKVITISIPSTNNDVDKRLKGVSDISCARSCRFIWNGHGRWIDDKWIPFLKSDNHDLQALLKNRKNYTEEIMYVIGDSVNKYFSYEYFVYNNVCKIVFNRCILNFFYLYPRKSHLITDHPKYGNTRVKFRHEFILDFLKNILRQPAMKSQRSVLMLNYNLHYAKNTNFLEWQDMIQDIISLLKDRQKLFESKIRVVWRTATAIHIHKAFGRIDGRFLTSTRVRLFSAYALSEMCKAGIEILDWYPMSVSTLKGAKDNTHYRVGVFTKVMDTLTWYALTEPEKRSRDICFG